MSHRGKRGGGGGRGRGGGGGGGGRGGRGGKARSNGRYQGVDMEAYTEDFSSDFISLSGGPSYGRNNKYQNNYQHGGPSYNENNNNNRSNYQARSALEENIYGQIVAAKARQNNNNRGNSNGNGNQWKGNNRQQQQQQHFQPPPIPKRNGNGKNSKHVFWPHPDNYSNNSTNNSENSKFNNNNGNNARNQAAFGRAGGMQQVKFTKASSGAALADPAMQHRHGFEESSDDDDDDDDDDDNEGIIGHEFDGSGIDSDESDEEEYLMQQFNWVEEDQDPDRKISAPIIPKTKPVPPIASWGGALSYQTPQGAGGNSGTDLALVAVLSQPEEVRNLVAIDQEVMALTEVVDDDMADEMQNSSGQSRPLSALSTASLASLGHKDKKSKSSDAPRTQAEETLHDQQQQQQQPTAHHTVPISRHQERYAAELVVLQRPPQPSDTKSQEAAVAVQSAATTLSASLQISNGSTLQAHNSLSTILTTQQTNTPPQSMREQLQSKLDEPLLWVMDAKPDKTVAKELAQAQDSYIILPNENIKAGGKKKKAHRSKRGGRAQKERQIAANLLAQENGTIFLEDRVSDEDDDLAALEDYIQNTMDPDNPDQFDDLLGALRGLNADTGHSGNVGGLGGDDSDFEQQVSEDDSQEEEYNFEDDYSNDDDDYDDKHFKKLDFRGVSLTGNLNASNTKTHRMLTDKRQNRRSDNLLREELQEPNLLPLYQSGVIGDGTSGTKFRARARGYDVYYDDSDEDFRNGKYNNKKKGNKREPHEGSVETLADINRTIEQFVMGRDSDNLQLPPMPKALRRRVHLLCNFYNLRSQSVGSGKRRFPILLKTEKTRMPMNPINVSRLLAEGDRELRSLGSYNNVGKNGKGGAFGKGKGKEGGGKGRGGGGGGSGLAPHGTVVGGQAEALSMDNLGHRMLAKMGWTPGVGLGATGDGITQPIEAIMRAKRRGLGHE